MANLAKVNENNIVERVVRISSEYDSRGQEYLNEIGLTGSCWIQTSINTRRGIHLNGGVPIRKNYALPGYAYNPELDAFIPPKPSSNPSWILDEKSGQWIPPKPYPQDRKYYKWDESTVSWIIENGEIVPNSWIWDSGSADYYSWLKQSFWKPPIPYPKDGAKYEWNESIINWSLVSGSLNQ